jgi:chromosome segregation ATPase
VQIIERTIAQLTDKLDRATARVDALTGERQKLGYRVHVAGDKEAKIALAQLNVLFAELAGEIESLDAALVEAQRRLDAAKAAAHRVDADEHRTRARALLAELAEKPVLDLAREHVDGTGPVYADIKAVVLALDEL